MSLDDYNIHVIASVLKQWLRDLPNPLMTFELYEEFLRAMGMCASGQIHNLFFFFCCFLLIFLISHPEIKMDISCFL